MTEPIKMVPIRLEDERRQRRAEGTAAALYVMVTADSCDVKVGALEKAARAERRLREVAKHHLTRIPTPPPEDAPMRLAVVAELNGLVLGPPGDMFYEQLPVPLRQLPRHTPRRTRVASSDAAPDRPFRRSAPQLRQHRWQGIPAISGAEH